MRKQLIVAAAAFAAGACQSSMVPPQPSMAALQILRSENLPAMQVGTFEPAADLPPAANRSLAIRALVLTPPDNSFAKYLQMTLEADLRSAGKLDQNSNFTVKGLLTQSDDDAGIGTGTATIAARFTLLKNNQSVFEKELSANDKWESSFVGAEAIPEAANHYTALYDKLVVELLTDQDFQAAAR